jgi:hypothetical protein
MLFEARRYLLSVGIFGWTEYEKNPYPFLDNHPLIDHVAAIVLASYYLQSSERVLGLIRKTCSLYPGCLRQRGNDGDLEAAIMSFSVQLSKITSANILNDEEGFAFLVNNILRTDFLPEN